VIKSHHKDTSRPSKQPSLDQFSQGLWTSSGPVQPQKQKASAEPRPKDAQQTSMLRGHKWKHWKGVDSVSGIAQDAGTVVCCMIQHSIKFEWLPLAGYDRSSGLALIRLLRSSESLHAWPDGVGIVKGPSAGSGLRDQEFVNAYCGLWRLFDSHAADAVQGSKQC
jgi:hypothetical protein